MPILTRVVSLCNPVNSVSKNNFTLSSSNLKPRYQRINGLLFYNDRNNTVHIVNTYPFFIFDDNKTFSVILVIRLLLFLPFHNIAISKYNLNHYFLLICIIFYYTLFLTTYLLLVPILQLLPDIQ